MIKKISFLFIIFAVSFSFYHFNKEKEVEQEQAAKVEKGWKKYTMKNKKTSFTHAKTIDLVEHKIAPKPQRKPASKLPMREGRILEGENARKYTSPVEELSYSNRVSADWREVLGHNLARFQPEGTEVLIKREKSMIYIHKGVGQYREQVLISYKLIDGRNTSHRAMIDSSNGKILYTFNRQKNEYFRGRPGGFTHPLAQ